MIKEMEDINIDYIYLKILEKIILIKLYIIQLMEKKKRKKIKIKKNQS